MARKFHPHRPAWISLFGAVVAVSAVSGSALVSACSSEDKTRLSGDNGAGGNGGSGSGQAGQGGDDGGGIVMTSANGAPTVPFEPVGPPTYVPKVKNLLTGLAATDDEIAQVTADPTQLRTLIDTWTTDPKYASLFQGKMIEFFRNAFQQNQVVLSQLQLNTDFPVGNFGMSASYAGWVTQSLEDSFPETVWQLVAANQPLTSALTTDTYMLTTVQMAMLSYLDELQVDDNGKTINRLTARHAMPTFSFRPGSTATFDQVLDSTNANFHHWPIPTKAQNPASTLDTSKCTSTPDEVYDSTAATKPANESNDYSTLWSYLFGSATYTPCFPAPATGGNPPSFSFPSLFTADDFTTFRAVKIVHAATTDTTAPLFWDIPSLRTASQMTLHTPRVGFSGTLAYEANWGTNVTNENRVTANQSLIVALGKSIDGEDTIATFPVNATDSDHASNVACSGCHDQIDPLKQFFRESYSLFYRDQEADAGAGAGFNIDSQMQPGSGVGDLMNIYAGERLFPTAWTQKLQFWATSTKADDTDPEMVRIASVFQSSGFNFKTLVREVFSSPIVTFAAPTKTTEEAGVLDSVSRADHYCASLSNRLGIADICGLTTPHPTAAQGVLSGRAQLLPVDTYYRAFAIPSLPTDPDMFFRATVESMCSVIAPEVVDADTDAGPSPFHSADPTGAIAAMVANLMGLPLSDARNPQAVQILTDHQNTLTQPPLKVDAKTALESTFVVACTSPSAVLLGL